MPEQGTGNREVERGTGLRRSSDIIYKVRVAAKEMRETIFWLKLVHRAAFLHSSASPGLDAIIREANELAAILMASARTARTNSR